MLGQRLEHVSDVAGEVVRGRKPPKRVGFLLFLRADGAGDGDHVLLVGHAVFDAHLVKRIVSAGAAHGGEVELVYLVAL